MATLSKYHICWNLFFFFFWRSCPRDRSNIVLPCRFCIVSILKKKTMQLKISPVEDIVNAAILDSALERFFSVGEGIPKRHRLGYQKTKTPLHEPYMGIYVSGTPVRGGDRAIYLQRLRWLHSEDQRRRLARTRRCLLSLTKHVADIFIFFDGFINAHFE